MESGSLGVIFDWDGVVIDSAAHHERSWELLAEEEGLPLPENHFKLGFGKRNATIIPNLYRWATEPAEIQRLSLRKEELYRELLAKDEKIKPLPGVRDLLEALKAAEVPAVIGSSTERQNIEVGMQAMGLAGFFAGMVTSEDVSEGKPDPEVFLKGAGLIGRVPGNCVVIEDSHSGLEAARRGGMHTVAVATTHPPENLEADRVVHRLTSLTLEDLRELAGQPLARPGSP